MFYNPDWVTMAPFTAPAHAHEEQNREGLSRAEHVSSHPGHILRLIRAVRGEASPLLGCHLRALEWLRLPNSWCVGSGLEIDGSFGMGLSLSCAVWGRWHNLSELF